ncbi:hypothetical protein ACPOL_4720 [Acidisarcina polymorpha]|uniref:Uncharacterized protein n=1 Tax=Acidisarcina polymorpha TaxID=2211140 RepID=A0A2Z5G4F5_9BACT|nr:hypothetical protein ACPOL_4720 [Acidisarcina polymorpha]
MAKLNPSFGHLAFASALTSELSSNFETGAGTFNGDFPFHLGKIGNHVEEEASLGCSSLECVGEAFELHAQMVNFANQVHEMLEATA